MNYATALVGLPLVCEASGGRISTPEEALGACKDLAMLAQESFHSLSLNNRNRLINRHMVSLGTVNSAPIGIADCFRGAISDSAVSVLLAHNHCSGDTTPSAEDVAVTKRLIEAGKIVGIRVVDHIIVGRDRDTGSPVQLSLRERGLCQFE
jgi:DNA repair protein RadC